MKFSILLIFGVFSCAHGTEVSENNGKVYSCQIKQEQCQFATVAPVYYTQCKNDDTICSGGGGESDPCEGDSPDPEEMKFCTAKMAEISDLTDAQNHGFCALKNVLMDVSYINNSSQAKY